VGQAGIILRTTDGGLSWNPQTSNTTVTLYEVEFVDVLTGTVVGQDGTILRTVDGGAHWVVQETGENQLDFHAVFFLNGMKGIAVGEFGLIRVTSDGGASWTSQASLTNNTLLAVHFFDALNGTAVGTKGTIIATTDAGATWETQVSGTTNTLNEVFYSAANRIVAVGEGGIVLTKTIGGTTGVETGMAPQAYGLGQNYPNPFNPSTTVTFQLPVAGPVRIAVYDMVGREVAELANGTMEAGEHAVTFHPQAVASGMYVYRITSGSFSAARVMTLLK
jgi:photosystem II stability/assembly factor-like uncharacterized protein